MDERMVGVTAYPDRLNIEMCEVSALINKQFEKQWVNRC